MSGVSKCRVKLSYGGRHDGGGGGAGGIVGGAGVLVSVLLVVMIVVLVSPHLSHWEPLRQCPHGSSVLGYTSFAVGIFPGKLLWWRKYFGVGRCCRFSGVRRGII